MTDDNAIPTSTSNTSLDDAADVTHSTAFVVLETLVDEGQIAEERSDYLKEKFKELHSRVLSIYKRDNVLLKRARQLRGQLEIERKRVLSKGDIAKMDDAEIQRLKQSLLDAERELNTAQDRESVLQVEALEYDRQRQSLILERQDAIATAEARIRPQMEEMERGVKEMGERVEALMSEQVLLNDKLDALTKEEASLQNDATTFATTYTETEQQFVNREHEPERAATQLQLVQRTLASAEKELDNVNNKLSHQTEMLHTLEVQRSSRASDVASVESTIQRLRNEITTKQNTLATLHSSLEAEEEVRQGYQDRLQELDRLIKAAQIASRDEHDTVDRIELEKQRLLKSYASVVQARDNVKHECESITDQIKVINKEREEQLHCCETLNKEVTIMKQKNEVRNRHLLLEQRKEATFLREADNVMNDVREVEGLIYDQLAREEVRRGEILKLSARRQELNTERVREAGRLSMVQNEARMKMQQLVEQKKRKEELRRCYAEMREELHNVKRDRSFKATQIQALTQKMTEVAEKTTIIERELEALMAELELKEKEVIAQKRTAQNINNGCLHLWEERNKLRKKYTTVVYSCKEMKNQLERLTGDVMGKEEEMTLLQSTYADAIERRNQNGIELIDRNDEMTLLTEKVKVQKRTIDEGAELRTAKEETIRALKRQLADVRREMDMCQRTLPKLHSIEDEIEMLTADINDEQWRVTTLERDLTDPHNTSRWNRLKMVIETSSSSSEPPSFSSSQPPPPRRNILNIQKNNCNNWEKEEDDNNAPANTTNNNNCSNNKNLLSQKRKDHIRERELKRSAEEKNYGKSASHNNKESSNNNDSEEGDTKGNTTTIHQDAEGNSNYNRDNGATHKETVHVANSSARSADNMCERLMRPSTAAPPSSNNNSNNNNNNNNNTTMISTEAKYLCVAVDQAAGNKIVSSESNQHDTQINSVEAEKEIFGENEEVAEAQVRLQARCQELESRLNNIEERISEKELILQEVRELSERIGKQAINGRECTLAIARQINLYQSNIREKSRQMKSTISELSLCQASSLQLEKEVEQLEIIAEEAKRRMEAGLVPFAEAEEEYIRARESNRRYEEMLLERNKHKQYNLSTSNATNSVMTTAIPRATAYVPDDELGLPIPFSHFAPFRPSEPLTINSWANNNNNGETNNKVNKMENNVGRTCNGVAKKHTVTPAAMPWSAKNVNSDYIVSGTTGTEVIVANNLISSISISTAGQDNATKTATTLPSSPSEANSKSMGANNVCSEQRASSARYIHKSTINRNASCLEEETSSSAIPRASSTTLEQKASNVSEQKRLSEQLNKMSSTQ